MYIQNVGGYVLRRGQATLTDVRRFLEGESEHKGVKFSQVGGGGDTPRAIDARPATLLITPCLFLAQVKESLVVLIQHGLVRVVMPTAEELQRAHPRTFVYYEVREGVAWICVRKFHPSIH
jgi:hypothetical protein